METLVVESRIRSLGRIRMGILTQSNWERIGYVLYGLVLLLCLPRYAIELTVSRFRALVRLEDRRIQSGLWYV